MNNRDLIEIGTSLIGGAAIGAALMYVMDPDMGEERREYARERAAEAMESARESLGGAGETLGETWQSLADRVRSVSDDLTDTVSGWTHRADKAARAARKTASGYRDSARDRAMDMGKRARNRLPSWTQQEDSLFNHAGGVSLTALGFLAVGAGLMWFMDPANGRRRRALVRDKVTSVSHHAGDTMAAKGRHWRNVAQGMAAETRSAVKGVKERYMPGRQGQSEQSGDTFQPAAASMPQAPEQQGDLAHTTDPKTTWQGAGSTLPPGQTNLNA